ncbi:hypothetical protein [Lactobacillus sp. ESL0681]|uniref:hypothetical protein n=1 Tax=Lactobacillus sp. ESL0681 TaxID=2983211 RepID=UPI0023F6F7C7|nr:hypothetical protein [Lactobacillus sp. ESL0681]WEV40340.1 hypothetical protein OZX59_00030 [Lactobacillus sp. ESL0681]
MDIKSVIRMNDGRTSYQVKESMDEIIDNLFDAQFVIVTDFAIGEVWINTSNIVSISRYNNEYNSL